MDTGRFSELKHDTKLVIWDLDETFWQGTLSEGGIVPVAAHLAMIRTLVERGIMCSICSKNDFLAARQKLQELGVWDLFVFAHIDWTPKGAAIRSMLERMGLRAENAVFMDDNHLNLEEVRFFCPGIACVDARTEGEAPDLTGLLDLQQCRGKEDRELSRLGQYRMMETRAADLQSGGLSNEEFLRQSGIELRIITDLDGHMDRVVELINRTNQLNFTKRRVHDAAARAELDEMLRVPGVHAGLVHVRDRYGDYGIVGFFCVRRRFNGTTVQHFAFSCRTLNMGVEQWIWQHLDRPEFEVVGPVANPLDAPAQVDWIRHVAEFGEDAAAGADRSLILVGGCDLQQVSFYCGARRVEFVNKQDDRGVIVRYDDAGFLLNPRDPALAQNWVMQNVAGHSLRDMLEADAGFAASDVIILSMFFSFQTQNLFTHEGQDQPDRYLVTIPPKRLAALTRDSRVSIRMLRTLRHLRLTLPQRLDLLRSAFARVHALKRDEARLFLLGVSLTGEQAQRAPEDRRAFNQLCREFCLTHSGAEFIDIDEVVPAGEFVDSDHYTRTGYFKIAERINALSEAVEELRRAV